MKLVKTNTTHTEEWARNPGGTIIQNPDGTGQVKMGPSTTKKNPDGSDQSESIPPPTDPKGLGWTLAQTGEMFTPKIDEQVMSAMASLASTGSLEGQNFQFSSPIPIQDQTGQLTQSIFIILIIAVPLTVGILIYFIKRKKPII